MRMWYHHVLLLVSTVADIGGLRTFGARRTDSAKGSRRLGGRVHQVSTTIAAANVKLSVQQKWGNMGENKKREKERREKEWMQSWLGGFLSIPTFWELEARCKVTDSALHFKFLQNRSHDSH